MTAVPSILVRKLRPEDMFLIFATDGLWEHLSDEAAVKIVSKNPRVVSITSILFNIFLEIWSFNINCKSCNFSKRFKSCS